MGALPNPLPNAEIEQKRNLPDYMPARMVNEFAYCPRLFFYEWVEGLFAESVDTVEGKNQHRRLDEKSTELPEAGELTKSIHARSVTLSSERLRVIAKMDLVEAEAGSVTPVDYKHGRPREGPNGLELWPADKAQLAVQGIILRENGYRCDEGIVYYRKTGQRVRVMLDGDLVTSTEALIQDAWITAKRGQIPPPLVDSPKCPGCSLVAICLPDETLRAGAEEDGAGKQLSLFEAVPRKPIKGEVRPLITPRSELRPLYLNSQGLRVGKSRAVLQVREKDALVQEVRIGEICQVSLMGNVQISTQAVQALCEAEVPICYFRWAVGSMESPPASIRRTSFCAATSSDSPNKTTLPALSPDALWREKFEISGHCCNETTWNQIAIRSRG
jgi:CRISP-associated protein Cas1